MHNTRKAPLADMNRSAKLSQAAAKPMHVSSALGLSGLACMLGGFLMAPTFVATAIESHQIENRGAVTAGQVIGHHSWQKRDNRYYSASVEYKVNGRTFTVGIQGSGANAQRLPLGAAVDVRYLPDRPYLAEAHTADASTNRPTLRHIMYASAVPVLLLLAAYLTRRKKQPAPPHS